MDALTILPFALLLAAVLGLWLNRAVWIGALLAAVVAGYFTGALRGLAALWMLIAAALAWFYTWTRRHADAAHGAKSAPRALQLFAGLVFFVYALAMALPLLPGFVRIELVAPRVLSAGAEPYGIGVGFPKVVAGILILGLINPVRSFAVPRPGLGAALAKALPIWIITTLLVMVLTLCMGYTAFAPKWDTLFLLWAPINLFFTCLAEEAFFRGYLQRELANSSRASIMPGVALVIAALIFGLLHFKGGPTYVAAGAFAGLGYGWAYLRTGRIEAAMAVHFALNATHFLLFAYPRLA
jgi:membrane protease YdiL (CAAX protease family)